MGIIKLPKKSINYFKNNLDDIFNSGNLAEEAMDEGLPKREQRHANSTNHILGTDGIFTIKEIVFGGVVISFGMTWGGACLFFGWQCGRLVYYAVRSLITLIT